MPRSHAALESLRYGELIERRSRRQPHEIAMIHDGASITYADLLARVDAIHLALDDRGVTVGDRVLCYSENHPDLLASMLAVLRIGAIFCPIGSATTTSEAFALREKLGARILLSSPSLRDAASHLGADQVLPFDRITGDARMPPPAHQHSDPRETALILFTSGSTGTPKGVEFSHETLFFGTMNNLLGLDFTSDDIALVYTPLSHAAALVTLAGTTLHKGGTLVLEPKFQADRVLELIATHAITIMFAVPATLTLMERSPLFASTPLSSIRWVLGGGAAFAPDQITRWTTLGVPVISSFGMTEAGPSVSFRRKNETAADALSSGAPGLFTEVRVVVGKRDADTGEVGEILVRGPHTATRYWRDDEASNATFRDGWLLTGDRGYLDETGELYVTGRYKDLIITGGENVDPVEVEHAVAQFPGVLEVAVIGRADELWGERVTAVVVASAEFDLAELRDFLAGALAGFKIPRALEFRDALPRNALGKLLRAQV